MVMMMTTRMSKETQGRQSLQILEHGGGSLHAACLASVATGADPGTVGTRQHSLLTHESIPSELMGQACAAKAP